MHNKLHIEPVVLFATPPPLHQLCGMTVSITGQVTHSQVASTWQPQILKCREIIFTEPDIIATPSFDRENSFEVVLQQSLFKTGKLQSRFQKIGLEASKPHRVTPVLYQSCLRYTLLARIAPSWNKAGEWLIQGRDFLSHTGYSNAVKMNLTVTNDELFVSMLADCAKFPPMQLTDLDVDDHVMRQLVSNNPYSVVDMTLFNCWCHVLPSMKRGRICSVSRTVPQEGPFKSYRDLKRHWKNTYGYRLPENEEEVLFFEISFRQNGGKHFTYPSVCLRATQMQRIPRVDPKPILTTFIQDLHSKLTSVCGHPFKFLPKVRYAIPDLYECGQERSGALPNLSNKNPAPTMIPLRNSKDLSHLYAHRPPPPVKIVTPVDKSPANSSQIQTEARSSYDAGKSGISMAALIADHQSASSSHRPSTQRNHPTTDTSNHTDDVIPPSQNASSCKIIPMFKPKPLKTSASAKDVPSHKTVPIFRPKPKPSLSSLISQRPKSSLQTMNISDPSTLDSTYQISCFQERKGPMPSPLFETDKKATMPKQINASGLPEKKKLSTKHSTFKEANTPVSFACHGTPSITSSYNRNLQSPSISGSTDIFTCTANNSHKSNSLKRSASDEERDGICKKQRAKPQIQDVDVEMLARANQLNKVNSVTLLAWLRMKRVPCKAKDKKADLMNQVYHMLNLQTAEA